MTELALVKGEVLDSELTLQELASVANDEHVKVGISGIEMLEHAIRAGEALLAAKAKCSQSQWNGWVASNVNISPNRAYGYMRLARYQDQVRRPDVRNMAQALDQLRLIGTLGVGTKPQWMRDRARDLSQDGATPREIAEDLGINVQTVRNWLNPNHAQASRDARRRGLEIARVEARRRQDEAQALVKRAFRKLGGARSEAYAMGERFQDVIGAAHREATDSTERQHWALAGEHYRKMRDEIVKASGVL